MNLLFKTKGSDQAVTMSDLSRNSLRIILDTHNFAISKSNDDGYIAFSLTTQEAIVQQVITLKKAKCGVKEILLLISARAKHFGTWPIDKPFRIFVRHTSGQKI